MGQKVSIGPGQPEIITKLCRSTVLCSENELAKSQLIWTRTPPTCKALAIARGWCVCTANEWKSFWSVYGSKKYHKTKQKSIPKERNGVWKVVRLKLEWFSVSAILEKGQVYFFITHLTYWWQWAIISTFHKLKHSTKSSLYLKGSFLLFVDSLNHIKLMQ